MTLYDEEWKSIVGYEGKYEVSSRGRVRRLNKDHRVASHRYLNGERAPLGYQRVFLGDREGKIGRFLVHRLVMAAFVGPCPEGHVVNHIDANPSNNDIENLEYVTSRQNALHTFALGRARGKANAEMVEAIRAARGVISQRKLAKIYGLDKSVISRIQSGKAGNWWPKLTA